MRQFFIVVSFILLPIATFSADYVVTNNSDSGAGSLRTAITQANSDPGSTITVIEGLSGQTITLESPLPMIGANMTIIGPTGGNIILDGSFGGSNFPGFFIRPNVGAVSISNFNIQNCITAGGNGGSATGQPVAAGGGGLGAGGAIMASNGNTVTIENVQFLNNNAVGGSGGSTNTPPTGAGLGGGGFCGGNGGSLSGVLVSTGGGGGDINGQDGFASPTFAGGNGGDGSAGGAGVSSAGGGGGGGGVAGNSGSGSTGGAGGGTGGGGGGLSTGGAGAFGGGGGGGSLSVGGNGGFGGGGGGSGTSAGTSLFGGGSGNNTGGGGGGAGLGGAIFAKAVSGSASSIIIGDDVVFSGNTATGGSAGSGSGGAATAGQGLGDDIFLMSGSTLTFNITSDLTITSNIVSDGNAGGGGSGGGLVKTGSGTLTLSGANTYTGGTTVSGGTLAISYVSAIGDSSAITLSGGTLQLSPETSPPTPPPTSGLLFWYDATENVTTGPGSVVNSWTPRAGSATTMSLQGAGGTRPTYSGSTVDFSASSSTVLQVVNSPSWTTGTVVLAMTPNSASGAYVWGTTGGGSSPTIISNFNPNETEWFSGGISQRFNLVTSPPPGIGVYAVTYNVGNSQGYFNNVAAGSGSEGGQVPVTFQSLGNSGVIGINPITASISHWLVYDTQLTTLQLTDIYDYINYVPVIPYVIDITVPSDTTGSVAVNSGTATISNAIVNTGTFNKTGSGTLLLDAANTYSGGTTISGGTLQAGLNSAFSGSSAFTLSNTSGVVLDLNNFNNSVASISGGGSSGGNISLGSGTLTLQGNTSTTFSGVISGSGSLVKNGSGTLTLDTGASTYSGGTTLNAGGIIAGNNDSFGSGDVAMASSTTLSLQPSITLSNALNLSGSATFNVSSGTGTLSGVITNASGTISKTGGGTLVLSQDNSASLATPISIDSGVLSISADNNIGDAANNIILNGGALKTTNTFSSARDVTINAPGGQLAPDASTTLTLSGAITGAGELDMSGAGTVVITGSTSYEGATRVTGGGTLSYSGTPTISPTTSFGIEDGTVDISGISSDLTIMGLSGIGNFVLGINDLILDETSTGTFSGVISGSGGFTKNGTGTFTLNGNNTYTGDTTVNDGTLLVNGEIAGNIYVNTGSTLRGTGSVIGTISVQGGTLFPGNSPSSIGPVGTLTFDSNSNYQVEITPSLSSYISVVGLATLAGDVTVVVGSGSYPASGQYQILGAGSISGAFNPTVLGGASGFRFSLNQSATQVFLLFNNTITPVVATSIPLGGLSGNDLKVAKYLNNYAPSSTLQLLDGLTGNTLQNALNSVSPARNAISNYICQQTAFSVNGVVASHLDSYRIYRNKPVDHLSKSDKRRIKEEAYRFLTQSKKPVPQFAQMHTPNYAKGDVSIRSQKEVLAYNQNPQPSNLQDGYDPDKIEGLSGWASGFIQYAHQKSENQTPSFNYLSETVLAGLDYRGVSQNLIGGDLGYLHSHFYEDNNMGSGNINNYFSSFYGTLAFDHFYVSPALTGAFTQTKNKRKVQFPGFSKKAKANIYSWQFIPRLNVEYDFVQSWGDVIPFSSVDWAINWQRGYEEKGAAPFNAKEGSQSNSMVRSETGLKFIEIWDCSWGAMLLKEKIGYVFEKPFGTGTVNAALTGIPEDLSVSSLNQVLNLCALGLDFMVAVGKEKPVSLNIRYETEIGVKYWSSELNLILTKKF